MQVGCNSSGSARRRRGESSLKVFVLTLALMLPDGGMTQIPIEIWTFARQSDCAMSAIHLNKGNKGAVHDYRCTEADPVRLAADVKPKDE